MVGKNGGQTASACVKPIKEMVVYYYRAGCYVFEVCIAYTCFTLFWACMFGKLKQVGHLYNLTSLCSIALLYV